MVKLSSLYRAACGYLKKKKRAIRRNIKPIGAMNFILIVLGVATTIFTVEMIKIYKELGSVPDVLIERYFTCVLGEGGFLCIIKSAKVISEPIVDMIKNRKTAGSRVLNEEEPETDGLNE